MYHYILTDTVYSLARGVELEWSISSYSCQVAGNPECRDTCRTVPRLFINKPGVWKTVQVKQNSQVYPKINFKKIEKLKGKPIN